MENMDNKFLKQRLDKFGENVSLPNSLKAENLLSLIENITQDEPTASPEKKVIWFDRKYAAVAAMFVLAVGFAVFYRNTPKTDMLERSADFQENRAFSESAPKMGNDEPEMFELYQDKTQNKEEHSQDNELTGGGVLKSTPQVGDEMNEFASEEYVDWDFSGGVLYQNNEKIFEFPNNFIVKDYYSYGDSLVFYGGKELDGKSSVYIFKKDDDGNFKITQSFRQEGSILEVYIFGERASVISVENDSTYIKRHVSSHCKGSFRCNFAVNDCDIYLSPYGFAISDGNQLAYAFDENGNLSSEIEIDKGKYFDGIEVQEKNIVVFLNSGEMLEFPIKK